MPFYKRTLYKQGSIKPVKTDIEKYPSDYGRWQRNKELDSKDMTTTYLKVENTKLNKKVVKATSYFADGSKMITELISNSSKQPTTLKTKNKGGTK